MAEATRLTRLGKLAEATALIRRLLTGEHAADSKASPTIIDGEYGLKASIALLALWAEAVL